MNDAKKIIATATSCAEYPDATLLAGGTPWRVTGIALDGTTAKVGVEAYKGLGVVRATVNRWESNPEPIKGPDAYAIRSHAFFRLRDRSPAIEAVAAAFTTAQPRPRPKRRGYNIEGATLQPVV